MRAPSPQGHPIGHMDVPASRERVASPTPAPRDHLVDLVVVPDLMRNFDRSIQVAQRFAQTLAAYDADRECEHGRLPTDQVEQTSPCGCWTTLVDVPTDMSTNVSTNGPRRLGRKLWCEAGAHEWERPRGPGRLPKSCPEHRS